MPLDPLTIVFAIVAIVVIWKLRSVLGERTGAEKPPRDLFQAPQRPDSGNGGARPTAGGFADRNVIRLPGAAPTVAAADSNRWRDVAAPGSAVAAGLDAIAGADPTFSAKPFIEGAKIAYEAIVTAFASGERTTLQNLLSRDVYEGFAAALAERERRGERLATTFVSMEEAAIEQAALEGRSARVTMRFRSKQITATHDGDGKLIEGDPDKVVDMDDVWTFAREVTSRDPNWKLVATQAGH